MKGKKIQELNGHKLETYLKAKGMSNAELALKMGSSRNFLTNAIRTNSMTLSYYKLMCMMLGVEESFFYKNDEEEQETSVNAYDETSSNTELLKHILNELVILNNNIAKFTERK